MCIAWKPGPFAPPLPVTEDRDVPGSSPILAGAPGWGASRALGVQLAHHLLPNTALKPANRTVFVRASSHHANFILPAYGPNSRFCALCEVSGDGGLQRLRQPSISRRFVTSLLPIRTPSGEREANLVAHPALRRVPVEPLNERAAVRMPELVGDYMRR